MASDEVRNLYAGAVNYADAAQLVLSHSASHGRQGLILPTHTLIGLAVELGFKAIYLHRSGDPQGLRHKDIRHNLVVLRDKCLEKGFKSGVAEIDQIIAIIGANYAAHEYRYLKSNSTIQYVLGDGVISAIQRFVDEVAKDVGIPIRPRE